MREQGDGEQADSSSPTMAAAAAAYQEEAHGPASHAPAGLDHNFHGAQQSLMFGDTSFLNLDPSSHEQVLPLEHHGSQAILETSDVDFLNNFFSNPDSLNQIQLSPYDFAPEDKAASSIFSAAAFDPHGGANGTINPSTLAPPQASLRRTSSHMQNHMPFAAHAPQNPMPAPRQQQTQHQQQQQQANPNMNAADYAAASTMHGFKSTPTQHFSQADASNSFVSASSWGSFMMPSAPPGTGADVNFQHQNGQPSAAGGARQHSFTPNSRNVMYFQGIPQQIPSSQLQRHYSADSSSHYLHDQRQRPWAGSPSTSSPFPHAHARLSTVSFGSDPSFEPTHYRNTTPALQDKSGNLVGVPYAAQAAEAGIRHNSLSAKISQQNGGSRGNAQMTGFASGRSDTEPARKRRKSQADREEEAEWTPDASGSKAPNADDSGDETGADAQSSKRPRSSMSRQVPTVTSPQTAEDEATRRGVKKPRETLTEQQKRQHHIQSEKKRREIINQGYSDLNILVPCLNGGKSGLSRSECLQESASYIEALVSGSDHIMKQLGLTEADLKPPPTPLGKPETGAFGT